MSDKKTPDAEESKKAYLKFLDDRAKITESVLATRSTIAEHSARHLQASAEIRKLVRLAIKKISDTLDSVLESRKDSAP